MFLKIGIEMFEFHNLSSVGYFRLLNKKFQNMLIIFMWIEPELEKTRIDHDCMAGYPTR